MTVTLTLPLPHKGLRPNSMMPWRMKFGLTKQAREGAKRETFKLIKDIECPAWVMTHYHVRAYFKTCRFWDRTNILGAMKAIEDGIADAIGQNDKDFGDPTVERFKDSKNPRLEILLEIIELI